MFFEILVGLINWKNTSGTKKNGRLLFCCIEPVQIHLQSLSVDLLLMCRVVIGTVETVSWLNAECVCVPLSACSPGHVPTLFLSISVPLLLSAQCLTPESAGGQTQAIDTSFTLLTFALLSVFFPFFFFFRNC